MTLSLGLGLSAQTPNATVRIDMTHSRAEFYVDGVKYTGSGLFFWTVGSKHTVEIQSTMQPYTSSKSFLVFQGWKTGANQASAITSSALTIVADQLGTTYTAEFKLMHTIELLFHRTVKLPGGGDGGWWPGWIKVDGQCFTSDGSVLVEDGKQVVLYASPNPGWAFVGWDSADIGVSTGSLVTWKATRAISLSGVFAAATRLVFRTEPPNLEVLVDRALMKTRQAGDKCTEATAPYDGVPTYPPPSEPRPPALSYLSCPAYVLCYGTADALPGAKMLLGAPPIQVDSQGKSWAFDKWDFGGGQNSIYTVPGTPVPAFVQGSGTTILNLNGWGLIELTAKFVRAAPAGFTTFPGGLKLSIDGRENWNSYFFQWAVGTTHAIGAPAEQVDRNGRRYRFAGWSDGSQSLTREVTITPDMAENGYRLTAQYQVLGQLVVRSEPSGLNMLVGETECKTPCVIDQVVGSSAQVTPAMQQDLSPDARLEFVAWADGGDVVRTVNFNDAQTSLVAHYRALHKLVLIADPPEGAVLTTDPASPDLYFVQGTRVAVTATVQDGYKFRRWEGSVVGSLPTVSITMNTAGTIVARLEKVPFLPPTAVRNAAGETPEKVVAAGSLIEIAGSSLADAYVEGPANPLAQTIQGVSVMVGNRLLPLVFVSGDTIRAQLPPDLPAGDYTLTVYLPKADPLKASFSAVRNAPGLFPQLDKELPYAFALKENGTLIGPNNPVSAGDNITLFGTGFGPFNPSNPLEGFATPMTPAYPVADSLEVVTGDRVWPYTFAGSAPGQVGMGIVRMKIDPGMPAGANLEIRVRANGRPSNAVLLPIK